MFGTLNLTGSTVNVASLGGTGFDPNKSYSWTIATATGSITGTPTLGTVGGADFTPVAGGFQVAVSGASVYLNFTPVPEPAAVLAVCAGAGAAWFARRAGRRRGPRADSP